MKLKVFYIASLIILGVLVVFTVFQPMTDGERHSEVQRAQLLEQEDEWIVEFDIINNEGRDAGYAIQALSNDKQYNESVLIKDNGMFTYVHHFYPGSVAGGEVSFAVYREGETAPIEQTTYFFS
ncbi:hypothetical protein ACFLUE_02970 [Chloroflexota bacterium]